MRKFAIIIASVAVAGSLLFSTSAFSGKPGGDGGGVNIAWKLVYEHDASGAVVYGEIADLISAVQNGADVKAVSVTPAGNREYALISSWVAADVAEGVCYLYYESNAFSGTATDIFMEPGLRRTWLVRTTGQSDYIEYDTASGTASPVATDYYHMKWFVK